MGWVLIGPARDRDPPAAPQPFLRFLSTRPQPSDACIPVPADSRCASDLATIRGVLDGKEDAIRDFADLLKRVPRMLGAQNARLGRPLSEHDLADLAQDTVVIILQKLSEYEGRAPADSWIYRICRLELMNGVRRARRAPRQLEVREGSEVSSARDDGIAERDRVMQALAKVGGVEAEAVVLKHFEGLTFEEMGARLEVPVSTLKARYYKGIARLESLLEERESQAGGECA